MRPWIPLVVWGLLLGNLVAIVWLWWHGGNVTGVHGTGDALTSVARITGLLGAYRALLQVVLLSRIPWLERVAGFDRLSVWHRWNGKATLLARPRPRRLLGLGLCRPGPLLDRQGDHDHARRRHLPRDDHRDRRHRADGRRRRHVARDRASAGSATRPGTPSTSRPTRPSRSPGSTRSRPATSSCSSEAAADYWRALYVATLALVVGFRVVRPVVNAFRYGLRVADVGRGGARRRLACDHRARARPPPRAAGAVLPLALPRPAPLVGRASVLALGRARAGRCCGSRSRRLGDFTSRLGSVAPGTRVVAEGPLGQFTDAVAPQRQGAADRRRHRHHARPRARRGDARRRRARLPRAARGGRRASATSSSRSSRSAGIRLELVVGDHATPEGRDLLSPAHLRELVPDLADRDVYVCGPPGDDGRDRENVRARAGVPRHHIHAERFAL